MKKQTEQQAPLIRQTRAHKFSEFIAYSTIAVVFLLIAAVAHAVSYFVFTWAFGFR